MEKLSLVHPETGEPTGKALDRAEAIAARAWCRSTNVFVFNSRGEILCHQRSSAKERMPGVWSTHLGGHVGEGETYESNALKELHEEAGIAALPGQLLPWRTTRIDAPRLWAREFVTLVDRDDVALVPQPGEVDAFSWMSFREIMKESKKEPAKWCVGTHDFKVEYQCMRSALSVASALGAMALPQGMRVWRPAFA